MRSPSATGAARFTWSRSAPPAGPPATARASVTRAERATRYTPGRTTAPATSTTESAATVVEDAEPAPMPLDAPAEDPVAPAALGRTMSGGGVDPTVVPTVAASSPTTVTTTAIEAATILGRMTTEARHAESASRARRQ